LDNSLPLTVCFFGTYRQEYSRNQILIKSLRRAGVRVIECHEPFWQGESDRVQAASGGWLQPGFLWRAVRAYTRLFFRALGLKDYQVLLTGYPGQVDVFAARLVAWLARKPLVWDIYMSTYQLAKERGLGAKSPFTLGLLRRVEAAASRLPDQLELDTPAHAAWYQATFGRPAAGFWLLPAGADESIFQPASEKPNPTTALQVIYYGTFIPNHGVPFIIEAARCLADQPGIRFELIGDGPQRKECVDLVARCGLPNVTFTGWMDKNELAQHAAQADVLLGAFGQTPMSKMTVQNKVFEGLALARPVITGDSPAIRQAFQNGVHLLTCSRDDPHSLAEAIISLAGDLELRQRLAENGHAEYLAHYTTQALGQQLRQHLEGLVYAPARKP